MRSEKELNKKGKEVAYYLRHKEHFIDKHGYAPVSKLLDITSLTKEELDWIVENNNKKRYSYNEKGDLIRANQGHNKKNKIDLQLKKIPAERVPFVLYHGTSPNNVDAIREKGLLPMNRQHVHLSHDKETAMDVGGRRKDVKYPVILEIHAKLMAFEGHDIFRSKNGVFLTDHVAPLYIKYPE